MRACFLRRRKLEKIIVRLLVIKKVLSLFCDLLCNRLLDPIYAPVFNLVGENIIMIAARAPKERAGVSLLCMDSSIFGKNVILDYMIY